MKTKRLFIFSILPLFLISGCNKKEEEEVVEPYHYADEYFTINSNNIDAATFDILETIRNDRVLGRAINFKMNEGYYLDSYTFKDSYNNDYLISNFTTADYFTYQSQTFMNSSLTSSPFTLTINFKKNKERSVDDLVEFYNKLDSLISSFYVDEDNYDNWYLTSLVNSTFRNLKIINDNSLVNNHYNYNGLSDSLLNSENYLNGYLNFYSYYSDLNTLMYRMKATNNENLIESSYYLLNKHDLNELYSSFELFIKNIGIAQNNIILLNETINNIFTEYYKDKNLNDYLKYGNSLLSRYQNDPDYIKGLFDKYLQNSYKEVFSFMNIFVDYAFYGIERETGLEINDNKLVIKDIDVGRKDIGSSKRNYFELVYDFNDFYIELPSSFDNNGNINEFNKIDILNPDFEKDILPSLTNKLKDFIYLKLDLLK